MEKVSVEFKMGQRVRHADGTLGHVTNPDSYGFVEWKSCFTRRVSNPSELKDASNEKFRWRSVD